MATGKDSKYAFLLALNPGEEYIFDNKPTLSEARRHVPASQRSAYKTVSMAVHKLRKDGVNLLLQLRESNGSRIPGNQIVVRMLGASDTSDLKQLEAQRQRATDAWRKRKQAEEAPLLPDQLGQAECVDMARRTAGAVRAQVQRAEAPKYDPAQVAVLVTAQLRGEVIQSLAGEEWLDDPHPSWTKPTAHYRIKPAAPREWLLVVGRDGKVNAAATTIAGLPHHDPTCRVRVREVTDEDE